MQVVIASSEGVPFAKTGGLADVCGALPVELQRLGDEVALFLPAYRSIWQSGEPIDLTPVKFSVTIGSKSVDGCILRSRLPDSDVPVYFIHQPGYFDRPGLYGPNGEDFADNCERFVFFCRGVLEALPRLGLAPQVLHCNDWQTGLIPALYRTDFAHRAGYPSLATLMTIHNLAYQGSFWHWDMLLTGIDWKYFNWQQMEFYGRLNLLKTGIAFADALSTVSPRYAQEIQTPEYGCGLDGVLRSRASVLSGILNGIDTQRWDPTRDPHLAASYDWTNWREGKAACKMGLQQELGLPVSPEIPVIGLIGRLASQKGWALILPVLEQWLRHAPVQWAVLGTGDWEYQQALEELTRRHPDKLAARLEFSDPLAHRIEAGSDLFVMPSRYEPCGLNQMYSLRYGTPPVVFATGGLADTVVDTRQETLENGTATGFCFDEYSYPALDAALTRAVKLLREHPSLWERLVVRGMKQDWSWSSSARKYHQRYESILASAPASSPA